MFRRHPRRNLLLAVLGTFALAGVAYAYWTSTGSGTGTAAAGTTLPLTVNQTTVLTPMYPGDSAQTISGTFTNTNTGPVYVATVTASIASVTKAPGAPAGTCDASDFTLTGAAMSVGAEMPVGTSALGAWTGAAIKFNNKSTNQDACKLATVGLAYAIS